MNPGLPFCDPEYLGSILFGCLFRKEAWRGCFRQPMVSRLGLLRAPLAEVASHKSWALSTRTGLLQVVSGARGPSPGLHPDGAA